MNYIVRADPNKLKEIETSFNVIWKSKIIEGLIFIECYAPMEYIQNFDGVISCERERIGTWNDCLCK